MDEKRKLLANFEKMLKVFDENSIAKLIFFILFLFYFFNFFILFLFFILFFENLLLKIEPSDITTVFYNNFFFGFGGGEFPPFSPWLRPCQAFLQIVYHIEIYASLLFLPPLVLSLIESFSASYSDYNSKNLEESSKEV